MNNLRYELRNLTRRQEHVQQLWEEKGQYRMLKFITTFLPKVVGVESCSIFIQDKMNGEVWLACSTDLDKKQIIVPKQGSVVGEVISTGRYQICTGLDKKEGIHKSVDSVTNFVTRDILCVPIKGLTVQETTGAIQVLNKNGGQEYTDADRVILEEAAYYVQMIVENLFLGQEMVIISKKVQKKMAFFDVMLWIWAASMFVMGIIVVISMTPLILKGF